MKTLEACLKKHSDLLIERYAILEACRKDIINACLIMEETYEEDQKLLIAGNGRSAADSEHIAGELMKRFKILCTVTPKMAEKLKAIDPVRGENLTKNLEHGLIAVSYTHLIPSSHGTVFRACPAGRDSGVSCRTPCSAL